MYQSPLVIKITRKTWAYFYKVIFKRSKKFYMYVCVCLYIHTQMHCYLSIANNRLISYARAAHALQTNKATWSLLCWWLLEAYFTVWQQVSLLSHTCCSLMPYSLGFQPPPHTAGHPCINQGFPTPRILTPIVTFLLHSPSSLTL